MTAVPNLALFRSLFVHADDAYATPGGDGIPNAIRKPLNDEVLKKHLDGEARILAYFVDAEGYASAICIDIDENKPELARRIAGEFENLGFDPWIESSKSKGFHVWTLTERVPAGVLRTIGMHVAQKAESLDLEVFPKQAQRTEGGLGNGVWLPLFGADVSKGKTVFLNRGNGLDPYPDQYDVLTGIVRASLETIGAAQAEAETTIGKAGREKKDPVPNAIRLGQRHDTLTRIAGANRRLGLVEAEISPILAEVNRTRCDPPVADMDVRAIARSIMRYTPEMPIGTTTRMPDVAIESPGLHFPAEVMTGAAGAFAHLYGSYMEAPEQFFFMSYMTCLGGYLSGSLTIDSELRAQPRLYTLLLADSADDRKSTAITKTTSFFRDSIADFDICRGVGSAEGLQTRLEGTGKKLLLVFDEFMGFVGKCKIESSVLLPCVNTLFEENYYESRTKKNTVLLNNAHLSILAASTIATYERTWSPAFTDIGFNNRLWLVTGKGGRRFSCPRSIPEESKRLARSKLSAVLDHAAKHPVMAITNEARELFDAWYMSRPSTIHGKRLDTYALRFMSLLAVNDLKPEIDVDTIQKVIALCDHQHHVRELHDPVDADNVVAKLEEKIRRVLRAKGGANNRDLKRALHTSQTGIWFYTTALENLLHEKEVGFDKGLGVYFLQPEGVTPPVTTFL